MFKNSSNEDLCFPPFESRTLEITKFNGLIPFTFCFIIIISTICLKRKRKASSLVADGRMNQVIGSFDTLSISEGEESRIRRGSPWLKEIEKLNLIANTNQFQSSSYEGYSRERDHKRKFLVSPRLKFNSRTNDSLSSHTASSEGVGRDYHTACSLDPSTDVTWRLSTLDITSLTSHMTHLTSHMTHPTSHMTHPTSHMTECRDEPMEWEGSTVSVGFMDNSSSVPLNKFTPFFRHAVIILVISLLAILIVTFIC
ncbi:PREDICTED: uncharacterized protein LOC109580983 [Amphimedon queenslandica]|uniref:Uncharacterized protein n=1 Tax=Amphimedon queenslandica TaxID=400682 RepID=A0A1X7V7J2_AMPQE|nr:PREDICTED: uncharacterized protein LOC109580983 [Amphimedon queenslandica]|eukprot:XP_019850201.1 PREDICTED: uncharacterized protein LOC109580983 [Amphimedon queenslandica]